MTSKRSLLTSALLVLALTGGVTACGGSDDDKSSSSSSSASSSASSSDGSSPSSGSTKDEKGDDVEFKASEGLAKDYPSDEVPLVAGKVVGSTKGAFAPSGKQVKGWTVRVKSKKSAKSAADAAAKALTDAGFEKVKTKDLMTNQSVLENDTYEVRVLASKVKGGSLVVYTVTFA